MTDPAQGGANFLHSVWEQSRHIVEERLAAVENASIAALGEDLPNETRRLAAGAAHKLSGTLGTFGLPEGSEIARDIETLLAGSDSLDARDRLELSELVVRLQVVIDGFSSADAGAPVERTAVAERVLLVAGDEAHRSDLGQALRANNLDPVAVPSPHAARRALDEGSFCAAVLMPDMNASRREHELLANELLAYDPPIPAVVLGGGQSFLERARLARLGARIFLPLRTPPGEVADAVAEYARDRKAGGSILLVDDDPLVRETVSVELGRAGLEVISVSTAEEFWTRLQRDEPDLAILDVLMPEVDGLDLCRTVRADRRWKHLPILFLTSRTDPDTVREVFKCGADDFISKPVVGVELVGRIRNRLERVRALGVSQVDRVTGAPARHRYVDAAEQLLRLASRCDVGVAVVVVELSGLNAVNRRSGRSTGDDVLAAAARALIATLRGEDVVGRWRGSTFALALFDAEADSVLNRLQAASRRFRERVARMVDNDEEVSWSAGVAMFPEDGSSLDQLTARASAHSTEARERSIELFAGSADSAGHGMDRTDIVLVEDDEALQALLVPTLESNGYSVRVLDTGTSAIEALTGSTATIHPQLVLLDVDLPGADGYSVLRKLRGDEKLRSTAVIMLTARGREEDVVDAMRLGAVDHITKPFSVAVLLQRVSRTLG